MGSQRLHLIFVLSNITFPAREGLHVQSTLLMRALRARGHKISVLSFVRNAEQFDTTAFVNWVGGVEHLELVVSGLNYPALLTLHSTPGRGHSITDKVHAWAKAVAQPVVVHLEGIALGPLLAHLSDLPCVMSTVDAWSLRQDRLAAQARGAKQLFLKSYAALSRRTERQFFGLAKAVHVVSQPDADYLRPLVGATRIMTIPVALPTVPKPRDQPFTAFPAPAKSPVVVFWGDLRVPHLRSGLEWLFREVNPILKKMGQPIRWKILGRIQPDVSLRQLTGESEYLDWVQDIDAELRQADAVVLPDTSGTGLKNRTLHAMACGIPVIGSTHAFEGFPVRKGVQAHVHDDAAGFADALMKVLHHPDHASGMSMAGRQFAVNGYGIESIASRWCDLYTSITTPRTTASVIMRA